MDYKIIENKTEKILKSSDYNYKFNKKTGYFMRWGKNIKDDPELCPFGPEILDIEVSTICSQKCSFCYKSNTEKGEYMTLETFKKLFKLFHSTLTQIAFGIGDIDANPDLFKIMKYCRDNEIIPNITINGSRMIAFLYDELVSLCGAVAVSLYDADTCYNAIKELTNRGLKQVNIHALLSEETFDKCMGVLKDSKTDPRLKDLNAVVFLFVKPKGDRNSFHKLSSLSKLKELVTYAFENNITIGFDSCGASNFLKTIKDHPNANKIEELVDACESTLFSYYINVKGIGFPCSFTEGNLEYNGIDLLSKSDFKDVWMNEETIKFRNSLLKNKDCYGCRMCPIYDLCLK